MIALVVGWVEPLEVGEFLTYLSAEKGRAGSTIEAYRRDLGAYSRWLAERQASLTRAVEADIEEYVGVLRGQGRAPATVARAIVSVRSLHRFLASEGFSDLDPAADVAPPRVPAGLPKALNEAEVATLINAVIGNEPVNRRDRAVIETLYACGLRISELVGISLRDLDLEDGLVRVLGKGSKERIVPVGRMARRALADWLSPSGREVMVPVRWARRDDSEAVFLNQRGGRLSRVGAWGIIRRYGDAIGLGDRLTPHVLRHSCATHLVDHGADIRVVQELLGHASISTTQVYTKVSGERLRAVYDAAHPRARHR